MANRVFLDEPRPLLFKAAEWMMTQETGRPVDFSGWVVVVPTAGAGRRLRERLTREAAASATGILPPRCVTPMGLLDLTVEGRVATPEESLLAWARAVEAATDDARRELFPGFSGDWNCGEALRIGGSLRGVCALLAEAGLTPDMPVVREVLAFDETRWIALAALFAVQRSVLADAGLVDLDDARIHAAGHSQLPCGVQRIVVAGVPDLNGLCRRYLSGLDDAVTVMADAAGRSSFDEWGAPVGELTLCVSNFTVCADAVSEAELAVQNFRQGVALCLADPALTGAFERALERREIAVFDPAGRRLDATGPMTVLRRWGVFCRTRRIEDLRVAIEHPGLARGLGGVDKVLTLVDGWLTERFFETLDQVRDGSDEVNAWIDRFPVNKKPDLAREFWKAIHAGETLDAETAEAIEMGDDLVRRVTASPLCPANATETWEVIFRAAAGQAVYPPREDDAVDLNGWLEAAWLAEPHVLLAGCVEGALPDGVDGHAFLPDSARAALGIATNATRHARDAFLLANLLASRPPGAVHLTFSRRGPGGDPSKPSRLLLDVSDAELPTRVREVFASGVSLLRPTARTVPWPLRLFPGRPIPDGLSVTAFGSYLKCPLRYYMNRNLRMEGADYRVRELDALRFGDLFHKAIEQLAGDDKMRASSNAQAIGDFLVRRLEDLVEGDFGTQRPFALRVQQESLQARLRAVARIEARERAAGWRITGAEEDLHDLLVVGGMKIRARVDRVEINEQTGRRRIIDYKTFAKFKHPEDEHLAKWVDGLPDEEALDEQRRWVNLQLPLYLALAREKWKDDALVPEVAYFLAPARVEDTDIAAFEMDEGVFASAMRCAESVAYRIRRGVFWPPRDPGIWDDFETVLAGVEAPTAFDDASVLRLKGEES